MLRRSCIGHENPLAASRDTTFADNGSGDPPPQIQAPGLNGPPFCPARGPMPLHPLDINTNWAPVTKYQRLERFLLRGSISAGVEGDQMEAIKIYLLMTLIAAIATASHIGHRRQREERTS
jgi:hypothetical protein